MQMCGGLPVGGYEEQDSSSVAGVALSDTRAAARGKAPVALTADLKVS